jgi:hypothetical protein
MAHRVILHGRNNQVAFRSEADIRPKAEPAGRVANDPKRSLMIDFCCDARQSRQ